MLRPSGPLIRRPAPSEPFTAWLHSSARCREFPGRTATFGLRIRSSTASTHGGSPREMMLRKYLIGLALATAVPALLAGCGGDPASAARKGARASGGDARDIRQVRIVKAEETRMARTVDVSGTLAADQQATLGLKVAGR